MTKQSPTITFIIPVFQAEEFLENCLKSIQNQSISDFEILCVNDSSTDSSQAILEHYALQDNRIRIFNLPAQKGPGNARNIGISNATGKYIRIVDADDLIPPDSTKLLLDAAEKYSSDFVKGGYEHCDSKGTPLRKGRDFPTELKTDISADKESLLWHFDQHWTFLFNTDLVRRSGIRYNTEMYNGEDVVFLVELAPLMQSVTLIPESVYFYRTHPESTTRKKRNLQYFKNIFRTYEAVYTARNATGTIESADYYLFHRFTGVFFFGILPSMHTDLDEDQLKEILVVFQSFLIKFDIIPRIFISPYSWKGNLCINKELIFLTTILLHSDIDTASHFFYFLAENKLSKKIRTSKEIVLRKKLIETRKALQNIQTSTFWQASAPLRRVVELWRKMKVPFILQRSTDQKPSIEPATQKQKIYEKIYLTNSWVSDESVSGRGSTLENTRKIRQTLPKICKQFNIQTIIDIPCGDFYWMSVTDLDGVNYLGHDIVRDIIRINQELYAKDNIRFTQLNILEDPLSTVDLILNRDCLVHFRYTDINQALKNIINSRSKYLLTTTFPARRQNTDVVTGRQWRPLNLEAAPFNFPPPLLLINEANTEASGRYQDKSLGLWKIRDIPSTFDNK